MKRALPFFAVVLAAAPAAAATRPVVVELFTSEGCSSCPPADAFLATLGATRPDVLPLDFHVTYWDDGGWRDPWALDAATARQRAYASLLGQSEVYTPEMVVDGREGLVGSDRPAALAAIARAEAAAPTVPLHLARGADGTVTATAGAGTGTGRLLLVGFDPGHDTHVGRGENEGRMLHEVDVVRGISDAGAWNGRPVSLARLPSPAGARLVLLLQSADGHVLGVSNVA